VPETPDGIRVESMADAGIPTLVRQLGNDSRRLLSDEVLLARLELKGSVRRAGAGGMWLAMAFGVGVVGLVAATVFLATLIGRVAGGHMWVGAVVTGLVELGVAALIVQRGLRTFRGPSYTLAQTRETLRSRGYLHQ
jgi:putative superfamily III holin-X